ncbi:MAG: four helix bundle protein [Phycisphaerales bacterium]|nr:four helix bundle protein [Phycisphaerales bacterium]MCI0674453.1 four helix bundle protein [Phycisphaerales bacterium]
MGRIQGDLCERSYQFARSIIRFVRKLPHVPETWNVERQLLKCGTSIGSNVCEADAALTDREFIQFCNISRREALETQYWLRLCRDEILSQPEGAADPLAEADQLSRILTTIVRKSRDHQLSRT